MMAATIPPPAGHNTKEVSQLARRKSEDSYTLPDLQARGLAALCEEFFAIPGVEEEYQAWLEAKKGKKRGSGRQESHPSPSYGGSSPLGEPINGGVAL